jgi:hypothetical protein
MRTCVHRGEYSYVYEYLRLYCVSKKKIHHTLQKNNICSSIFLNSSVLRNITIIYSSISKPMLV